MTEEFFLAYGNEPEPHRPPPRRRPDDQRKRKRKRRRRGRTGLALLLTLLLLGGVGAGVYLGYDRIRSALTTPDYETAASSAEVTLEIPAKSTGSDMAGVLRAKDVIASEQAFIDAWEDNPGAAKIQPGFYRLRLRISAADAILMLLDPARRIVNGVTVPEGLSTFKIYKLLAEKLELPVAEFVAAAKDPLALGVPDWWFKRLDGKKESRSIEGFLFPDTYEFPPDVTAAAALRLMVERFLTVTGDLGFVATVQGELGISPYEALIVASLAQAEAGRAEDLGKVARVAYNRVYKKMLDCACLQFDVTVNYSRELAGKDPKPSKGLRDAELNDSRNPYNRLARGLVPTPINNPGAAALRGAMSPPDEKWLYFVAVDHDGRTAFSADDAQFCRDIEKAIDNGVLSAASRCG